MSKVAQMMSKRFRQQAAPEIDTDVFNGKPTENHYFLSIFEEVVEKEIDDASSKITRLVKYIDWEPNKMIHPRGVCQNLDRDNRLFFWV